MEGAGGLLVRFDEEGGTLADAAALLGAPVLVVAPAGLGTLNSATLTGEALRARGIGHLGVVVGSWPAAPDLAARCNLADLPEAAGAPCSEPCRRARAPCPGGLPGGGGELAGPGPGRNVGRGRVHEDHAEPYGG